MNIKAPVAYFSLEIALDNSLPTYAGGLGVLAGDTLRSAADIDFPMVGITLLNRRGYLRQVIDTNGNQQDFPEKKYAFSKLKKLAARTFVMIGQEKVKIQAWQYLIKGEKGTARVILLDTDLLGNSKPARRLTDRLYASDKAYRLKQEIILGRGGVRILSALGYKKIRKYHVNEGHGSLAMLELYLAAKVKTPAQKLAEIRSRCSFTVHTPLLGAQDIFQKEFFLDQVSDWPKSLEKVFRDDKINMTEFGLFTCGYVNAVSKIHRDVSREMFNKKNIAGITNGVNSGYWTSNEMSRLFDKYCSGWRSKARLIANIKKAAPDEIVLAHRSAKKRLIKHVAKKTGHKLQEDVFTIGFARRFTPYKRATLIFSNLKRLEMISRQFGGLQIIFAGKAHPADSKGQELIREIFEIGKKLSGRIEIVILPGYDLNQAKLLVSGTDLWLNTPQPPLEASGTSGMKAAHNGVPQLSSNDGWWPEGYIAGQTGWVLNEDEAGDHNLYELLEEEILPMYYGNPLAWSRLMRSTISKNAPIFNTERMLREYIKYSF